MIPINLEVVVITLLVECAIFAVWELRRALAA
jgi:hypothetical protein